MQVFLTFSKNHFHTACTCEDSTVIWPSSPSISPSPWCPFRLQKFLRVQVPLGCLKTAFVTQVLGSRKFVKTTEVSIIFLLPERRKVSCRLYEIHRKANLLCNGYPSPKTWKKLILKYYISCVCLRWYMHSSPLNIAIAMAPVSSSKVSSCTSTSGVSQDSFRNPGAGKPRICQDNGSEYNLSSARKTKDVVPAVWDI